MRGALSATFFACSALASSPAAAERAFPFTQQSVALAPTTSELEPRTTFRAGRERYYSAVDGGLWLRHGLTQRLELGLGWQFSSEARDAVTDELSGKIERSTESEPLAAAVTVHYQLSNPETDLLGAALELDAAVDPQGGLVGLRLIADRHLGPWKLAGNLGFETELSSIRDASGAEVEATLRLEPSLAAAYEVGHGLALGLELRGPVELSGAAKSSTLFGGPVVAYAAPQFWTSLGVEPQLLAFSGQSPDSRLALQARERLEVRLRAGFTL